MINEGNVITTYKCGKCGNIFKGSEESITKASSNLKSQVAVDEKQDTRKCCPGCGEMGEFCEFAEESKADRYD